jgi:type I restriction enzyme S subunit
MGVPLSDLVERVDERNPTSDAIVFSVSERFGIVPQSELFDKPIAIADRSKYKRIAAGDVIYNPYLLWNGAVGACFVPRGGCVSPAYVVLRPKYPGTSRFLHYFFRSQLLTGAVDAIASGSVTRRRTAPVEQILRLSFELPGPAEQRHASDLLDAIDRKLELNRLMNETLEAMARALFKWWFVDFGPVRAKAEGRDPHLSEPVAALFPNRFEQSELGDIPAGWDVTGLDGIARFVNGLTLQKFPPTDGKSLPVVKIAQLRAGNTDGAEAASADLAPDFIVEDGDVLFSWSGSLECVLWSGGRGALNQHLFKVTSNAYPNWFYYFWIHEHLDAFRVVAAGKATTMGHIQRHHLTDAKAVVPPRTLLAELDAKIGPLVESIWRRGVESRTLAEIRDALLPKLISGELRVPELPELRKVGSP